jgi:hypothetical protein
MANNVSIEFKNKDEVVKALKEQAPELLEKHIKKQLRYPAKKLTTNIQQGLKPYQKSNWILEKSVKTTVSGSKGKIWLKQGVTDKFQTPRGNPQQYAYYIEHGNKNGRSETIRRRRKGKDKGEFYVHKTGEQRDPRPFMTPAKEDFITQEDALPYIQKGLDDAIDEFNNTQ